MSLDPGTSMRTSTPSSAAARSACTYGGVPAKYASVIHSDRRAALATNWSRRSSPAVPGSSLMTRSRVSPMEPISTRRRRSSSGMGAPTVAQTLAKACSTSATAGPSICTPVSRQGGMPFAGSPDQASPTHSPDTKATCPSTLTVFR